MQEEPYHAAYKEQVVQYLVVCIAETYRCVSVAPVMLYRCGSSVTDRLYDDAV
jgi:hypothetical protein